MKFTKTKALTTRLLVGLALVAAIITGLNGNAEAATCFTCHAPVGSTTDIRPVESTYRNITTGSIKGSHAKHLPTAVALGSACTACHGAAASTYATNHTLTGNNVIKLPGIGYSKGPAVAQDGNPVLGSCATASCHVTAYDSSYVVSPTWSVSTGCVGCHTGPGAFTGTGTSPATGSHTKHLAKNPLCGSCHAGAVAGTSGGTAHVDGNIDVIGGYTLNVAKHASGTGYSSCTTATCHVSQYNNSIVPTTVWGTANCAACHSTVGAFTGTGSAPNTGSHNKHMTTSATCATCHAGASAGTTGGNAHINGKIDVTTGGYPANITKHTVNTGYSICLSASCHVSPYGTAPVNSPTWGDAGGCISCHTGTGAFTGQGQSPNTGSHTKHMLVILPAGATTCASCHLNAQAGVTGGSGHADGNVDVIGYTANVTKHAINTGFVTCTSAACHVSPYGTASVPSPVWGVATACGECHTGSGSFTGAGAGMAPATGSHTKHMNLNLSSGLVSCANCHAGAIAGTSGGTNHIDGNIDVIGYYTPDVVKHTAGSGYSTCTSASCHVSPYGTAPVPSPTWGLVIVCGECHAAGGAFDGSGSPVTGSHTKHMAVVRPVIGATTCATCHTGAVAGTSGGTAHIDGNIDVIGYSVSNVTKHAINTGFTTCTSAACHVNPYGTGFVPSPTWGLVITCGECHTGIGAFTGTGTSPTTGSHTKHQAASAACSQCHTGAGAGTTGGTAHIDGNIDVIGGYTLNVTKHTAGSGYALCTNASCHADSYDMTPVNTPTWGVPGQGCANCHSGAGAFTGLGLSPATGSHTKHMAANLSLYGPMTCANCHTGAVAGTSGGTAHRDGNIDVVSTSGYTANVTKHTAGSGYSTCSTETSCHLNPYNTASVGTPTWGVATGCVACHNGTGAFTGLGLSPVTGSHTKHMTLATCANCHTGAIAGTSGGTAHMDTNVDVIAGYTATNVVKHTIGLNYSRCSNTCHVSPYGTALVLSPTWGVASGCAACHSGAGAFTAAGSYPNTGSHTKHQIQAALCGDCHAGASAGTTGGSNHLDGNIDVIGGYTLNLTKHTINTGYNSTCNNAYCHADAFDTTPVTTPTWGAPAASGCINCHTGAGAFTGTGSYPTTGSHTKHQAQPNMYCSSCHTGAGAGTTGGVAHRDGNIDVVGGYPLNVTKHTAGSGYAFCQNASCHADSYDTSPVFTPTWGVPGQGCANCHAGAGAFIGLGLSPVTGSHTKHMGVLATTCGNCHTGASAGTTGGTAHRDGNIDVIGGYTANVTKHTAGSGYSVCTAASCHNNPYGTSKATTQVWGTVVPSGCTNCHSGSGAFTGTGLSPVTGSHTKHMTAGNTCASCHAGAIAGTSGGISHNDTFVDVTNGYPPQVPKHTAGTYVNRCTSASCHANVYGTGVVLTPTWGTTPGCAACHTGAGAFTGTGSYPTTGSHTKHQQASATCGQCHDGASAGTTGGTAHTDGNIDVITGYLYPANITKHAVNIGFTCSNTACHVSPYGTFSITSPSWGAGGGCVSCHNGAGAFTGTGSYPTTGSHTKHQAQAAVCADCHDGAQADFSGGIAHNDGNIDVIGSYTANVTKHTSGSGYSKCAQASCHANPYGTGYVPSPTWGTVGGCASCHNGTGAFTGLGSAPATGRHTMHFSLTLPAKAITCDACHTGAVAGVNGGTSHSNGTVTVTNVGYTPSANVTKHAAGTYTGTCTVSCHGLGMNSNPVYPGPNLSLPSWNTPFLTGLSTIGNGSTTFGSGDCAKCHGYPPMTSDHNTVVSATECKGCHPHVNAAGNGFDIPANHVDGTLQATGSCSSCHAAVKGKRVNIMQQFSTASNSHHYQGTTKISGTVCYACHWEADINGAKTTYHGATGTSTVDLVIWNATIRPTTWSTATGITYLSGGATSSQRTEMAKITNHCTGCHSDLNMLTPPFPTDSRTPSEYSWEKKPSSLGGFGAAQSIGAKYLSAVTTPWGKFTGKTTNNKLQTKAYSAHNNAANNARGWSTLVETLQGTVVVANYPNTSGAIAVLCFDCHNSHGSAAKTPTEVTSSYDSATGAKKGGILKSTIAGQGGYTVTYMPGASGSTVELNSHSAGAGICFDCHNNATVNAATLSGSSTPWGYTATFNATQAIYGYFDTPYFGKTGGTFAKTVSYPYTASVSAMGLGSMTQNRGGHFGKSSVLNNPPDPSHQIGGLCTPCHDPHGVSPALAANQANAVPLLKGTFVTSPYKMDAAGTSISRGGGSKQLPFLAGYVPGYHIDQNTLQTARAMKSTTVTSSWLFTTSAQGLQTYNSSQFGGLCMNCHNQATLNSTAAATSANWRSSSRIHNSVAGWAQAGGSGGNSGNKVHAFTCSKCHTPHNSRLPRLLVTNCLDVKHGNRVISAATVPQITSPATSSSAGHGRFPSGGGGAASYSTATNPGPWYFGNTAVGTTAGASVACHDAPTAGGATLNATSQQWNTKSLW